MVERAPSRFDEVNLSKRMYDAVFMAKKLKKAAIRRQRRFISGIMSEEDVETIQLQLRQIAIPHQQETEAFHEIEEWRDKLIAGDNDLMNELITTLNADRQHLRQLVRNASKEAQLGKPPKSSRILFKHLKELQKKD